MALILLLSACGIGSAAEAEEAAWWTDRTWAGEIGICIDATDDVAGCQWLAGLLIHRRCSLKIYETIAAALLVGGDFETMYSDAEVAGDCEGPGHTSTICWNVPEHARTRSQPGMAPDRALYPSRCRAW